MSKETENVFYECTESKCLAGMEMFTDFNGIKRRHRVSFEAPLAEYSHIKRGQFIPEMKCYKCRKKRLIRV